MYIYNEACFQPHDIYIVFVESKGINMCGIQRTTCESKFFPSNVCSRIRFGSKYPYMPDDQPARFLNFVIKIAKY